MATYFWEFAGVQKTLNVLIPPLGQPGIAGLQKNSVVVASVTEITIPPGSVIGSADNIPFLGDANEMVIRNIVPQDGTDPSDHNGHVRMIIETNWSGGPINIRVNFAVLS